MGMCLFERTDFIYRIFFVSGNDGTIRAYSINSK